MASNDLQETSPPSKHGQARENLLKAAAPLFAKHGFENVSIREIANAAGVRHGGVNYHFRSKRELYMEVLQRFGPPGNHVASGGNPEWHSILEITDPAQATKKLRSLVHQILVTMALPQDSIASGLLRHEMERPDGPDQQIFENVVLLKQRAMEHLISLLAPTLTDPEELRLISIGITSQCLAFRLARPVLFRLLGKDESQDMDNEQIDRIVDRIMKTTLHGICGGPSK